MNADGHGPEGKMLIPADLHFPQMVIIEDTVVYTFTGGTFTVNVFIFFTAPGNPRMGPEAAFCFYVNGPPMTVIVTFFQAAACPDAAETGNLCCHGGGILCGKGTSVDLLRLCADGNKEEQVLEPAFRVSRDGPAGTDLIHKVLCEIFIRPGIGQLFRPCRFLFPVCCCFYQRQAVRGRAADEDHLYNVSGNDKGIHFRFFTLDRMIADLVDIQ